MQLPKLDDICDRLHVVTLPMRVQFRGIREREIALINGPQRWAEFSPFLEYDPYEASMWLQAALESSYLPLPPVYRTVIPVNATIPAVPAHQVEELMAQFPGVTTAKIKVAQPGQTLADDIARVQEARKLVRHIRIDANGGWTVQEAIEAERALTEDGPLEYIEQPCRSLAELVELRHHIDTPIAADESIRKVDDPLAVTRCGGADIAVLKVAPLGGIRSVLAIANQIQLPVVISSALDSVIGISLGLHAAGALSELPYACGLATTSLFTVDVAPSPPISQGTLAITDIAPEQERLEDLAVSAPRRQWWIDRIQQCLAVLSRQ